MPERDSRSGLPAGWAAAIAAAVAALLLYALRIEVLPLAFAAALAYLLLPVVDLIRLRLRLPRLAAVLAVYATVLGAVAAALWWAAASARGAAGALARLPDLLAAQLGRLTGPTIGALGYTATPDEVVARARLGLEAWLAAPAPLLTAGSLAVAGPAALVLTLVVLFYFLHAGRQLAAGALRLAPPAHRPRLVEYWRRIDPMLRRYVRGLLVIVAYASAAAWLMLRCVVDVPLAVPIALVVGVLELVPVVGPAASLALLGAIGLLGGGLAPAAILAGLAVALRVSIDVLVGPLVLGDAVTLHPVAVIVAFLLGGGLFGVLGVLFAVPVAAAIKIGLQVAYGEGPGASDPPPPGRIMP